MYELRLMAKPLTLVKIIDRVLYRTDGVTQIPVVSPTISGVDSGRFDGNELLSIPRQSCRAAFENHIQESEDIWNFSEDGACLSE